MQEERYLGGHIHSIMKRKRVRDEKIIEKYPEVRSDFYLDIYDKEYYYACMKLSDAYPICKNSINIPFRKLFSNFSTDDIIRNKGKSGQLMEKLCGLQLSNTTTDFEDGELKPLN